MLFLTWSRNVLKIVLAYKTFSLIFEKRKERKERKGTFTIHFPAALCLVWSLLFFVVLFCYILDLLLVPHILSWTSIQKAQKRHRPPPPEPVLLHNQLHRPFSLYCSPPPYAVRLREVQKLRHDSEHGVVATDARPDLFVVLFGVANLVELRLWRHKWWRGRWVQEQTLDRRHLNSHIYLHICSLQVVLFPLFRQEGYFIYFKQTAVTAAGKSLHTDGPSSDLPDGGCVWKANVKALKVSDFSKWLPMSTWQLLLMSSVNHCAGFLCLIPVYHLNWTSWVVFYHFTNCRVTAAQQEPQNWAKLTS